MTAVKPPWSLTGSGWIVMFKSPPQPQHPHYIGGLGAMMLIDYSDSPVGPYQEALFVPGLFKFGGRRLFSITRICVSTMASVTNGRRNWGIPKELAEFSVEALSPNTERWRMTVNDQTVLDVLMQSRRLRSYVDTRWLPYRPMLIQEDNLLTAPTGQGHVSLGEVAYAGIDARHFPDFSRMKPQITFHARQFDLYFPVPGVLDEH